MGGSAWSCCFLSTVRGAECRLRRKCASVGSGLLSPLLPACTNLSLRVCSLYIHCCLTCLSADKRALSVSGCTGDSLEEGLNGRDGEESCLVCTNRLRKHCSHLVGSSFLAVKAFLALNLCLLAENAD